MDEELPRSTAEALEAALPAQVHPLAREVARALEGAVYPLSRDELVLLSRENEGPRMLVGFLGGLPDRVYRSEDEVAAAVDGERG